ncbi:MAG: DNA mismatch repair endonuclease MutL [Desulfobacterales bacterium]
MAKIRILPDILSNKIAAGEVVERPGSVVKELVENALDAQSTQILAEIEKGGKSLIRVSDNGCGMSHDDALLAIERFATSKIHSDSDLFNISTLGFRGEAIPSIASVSRFTLISRDKVSDSAISIRIDGGKLVRATETGAPVGTMVSVQQLFFNTPARRKFLKTTNTEMAHIADTLSSMAMAHPHVQFRLVHNGKEIKRLAPVSDPLDRIAQVLGETLKKEFYPVNFSNDTVAISGAVASPRINRSTSRAIFIYVNGRFVKDRMIQHAIFQGYHQRLMKGQFPVAVLFLKVPTETIDVNVHPTKHEVRFSQQKKIHESVQSAVGETLRRWENSPMWPVSPKDKFEPVHIYEPSGQFTRTEENRSPTEPFPGPSAKPHMEKNNSAGPLPESFSKPHLPQIEPRPINNAPRQQAIFHKQPFSDLKIIGQCHHTYIILECDQGLILLDQHAAHERILYEGLKKQSGETRKDSQQLLVPETFDVGFSEAQILEKLIPSFEPIGLYMEPFGGRTFVVKAVPALLQGKQIQPLVRDIVEKILEDGIYRDLTAAIDTSLKLMACHGAVRAGQKLSDLQIKELLCQMDQCENPSNCPHGRPTWIRWELKFLEKSFHRIV